MIMTDVVSPPLPPLRGRRLALAVTTVIALIAIAAYQSLNGALGGSTRSTGAFGPQLRIVLERTDVMPGEMVRGSLTIEAPDGADVIDPTLLTVYPPGVAMTSANAVGTLSLDVPRSIPVSGKAVVPFTFDPASLPPGDYNINIELKARTDTTDAHWVMTTVTTARFARAP